MTEYRCWLGGHHCAIRIVRDRERFLARPFTVDGDQLQAVADEQGQPIECSASIEMRALGFVIGFLTRRFGECSCDRDSGRTGPLRTEVVDYGTV